VFLLGVRAMLSAWLTQSSKTNAQRVLPGICCSRMAQTHRHRKTFHSLPTCCVFGLIGSELKNDYCGGGEKYFSRHS
jgi:hypothetical protein